MNTLPITVIIATKNEEANLAACLRSLQGFDQIILHDSNSHDKTTLIAAQYGAQVINFSWNGHYPKKRQYALDHLHNHFKHKWIFFVDADERITDSLTAELRKIFTQDKQLENICGFFVRGRYSLNHKELKFGLKNNKLALLRCDQMEFPTIDDLDISPGMGEMEGHYQPIKKPAHQTQKIKQIKSPLRHEACNDMQKWHERHIRYAHWEDEINRRKAWPAEDSPTRRHIKSLFTKAPAPIKAAIAFTHSYIIKLGILDGKEGYQWALIRGQYYWR